MKNPKPLKILQRHEPMVLYKQIDSKQTNSTYLFRDFIKYISKLNYSYNTLKSYTRQINILRKGMNFVSPKLTVSGIEEFLQSKTINSHAAIKCFLEYIEVKWNKKFVSIKFPRIKKYEQKAIEILSEKQINKIIKKMPNKFKFFTKFIYMGGLRISEPLRLKATSINWERFKEDSTKHALLKISHTKSNRERLIPISPEFTKEILEFIKMKSIKSPRRKTKRDKLEKAFPDDYIFDFNVNHYMRKKMKKAIEKNIGWSMNFKTHKEKQKYLQEWSMNKYISKECAYFQILFKEASFKAMGQHYTPHILRKSRATSMLNLGIPLLSIRDFLGHRSLKTTEMYLASAIDQLSSDMQRLGL